MKSYTPKIEEEDEFTWRVLLIGNDTGKPITWIRVDKSEFPTKQEAINYLVERYESEHDDYDTRVSKVKGLMPTRMMIDYIGRKKKSKKPKTKRCRCKK